MVSFVYGFLLAATLPGVVLVVNFLKQAFRGGISFDDE